EITPIEHVRSEQIRATCHAAVFRFLDERENELVELILEAMVGVQRNVDRITLRGAMNVFGDRDCAKRHVLNRQAGCERAAAGGNLDDAVAFAFSEPAQHRISSSE